MTKESEKSEEKIIKKMEVVPEEQLLIEIPDDAKTIQLTFDQLKQTRTFADAHGFMPKNFQVEHHVFIQKLLDMATEAKLEPVVGNILASIKGIERISQTEAESKNLNQKEAQNTRVKVLIGRIDLGNKFQKELWNLAIGFMYNEKGIEVCIGTNISICSNLTIFGEAKHFKNYGRGGVDIAEMITHIESWLTDLEGIDAVNSELLGRMANVPIWIKDTNQFIGLCLKHAIKKNYHKGDHFALNMTEVNRMTSYIIDEEKSNESDNDWKPTLYNLYNAGTYVLTHSADLPNKFSNIKEFTHWFEKQVLLEYETDTMSFAGSNADMHDIDSANQTPEDEKPIIEDPGHINEQLDEGDQENNN